MSDQQTSFGQALRALGFTAAEAEVLKHRLDIPDAIEDVLTCPDEPLAYTAEQVQQAIDAMESGRIDPADPVTREVLADLIDGSTWYAVHQSGYDGCEITRAKFTAAVRVGQSAARKVSALIGREVRFPMH